MNRVLPPIQTAGSISRTAFSLLEVIIATAILSASSVMLLGLLSTGERHARQAERRVLGQMLCQSKLDELLAAPLLRHNADREPIDGYPEWVYSLKETPTKLPGLVRWHVSVTRIDPAREAKPLDETAARKTFELVRLQRLPAKMTPSSPGSTPEPISPSPLALTPPQP